MNEKIDLEIDQNILKRLRDKLTKELELCADISDDVKISTMTIEGKFPTTFNPLNIYNYISRRRDGIVSVIKGNQRKNTDTSTKNKNVFLNQVTVGIIVSNKKNPVSVKVFNNGTVHFTGCLNIDNLIEASHKLCIECKREIAVFDKNGKIKEIKFVDDTSQLFVDNLYDIKIDMINCIFVVPFKIDRPNLQNIMKQDGYNAVYDSNGHAGVKIRHTNTEQKVTIFVFESGSVIIILGKQGFTRINEIYTFIYTYLLQNYDKIAKDDELTISLILDLAKKYDENNNIDSINRDMVVTGDNIIVHNKKKLIVKKKSCCL